MIAATWRQLVVGETGNEERWNDLVLTWYSKTKNEGMTVLVGGCEVVMEELLYSVTLHYDYRT